jgi:hypothetical protein
MEHTPTGDLSTNHLKYSRALAEKYGLPFPCPARVKELENPMRKKTKWEEPPKIVPKGLQRWSEEPGTPSTTGRRLLEDSPSHSWGTGSP